MSGSWTTYPAEFKGGGKFHCYEFKRVLRATVRSGIAFVGLLKTGGEFGDAIRMSALFQHRPSQESQLVQAIHFPCRSRRSSR